MTASVQYLEAAKIEEVALQLRNEGYDVTVSPRGSDEGYDLVARIGNKKLAVEVKASSHLQESAEMIKRLRKRAFEHGYDEFRLVVVNPPQEIKVSIEGLERELERYLTLTPPPEVNQLPGRVCGVGGIRFETIDVTSAGIRIVGSGIVEVRLEEEPFLSAGFPPVSQEREEGITDFPFQFDVILGHNLSIATAQEVEVDTSSFYDSV
jgi:hypothetical protein